jgi:hypothetical protein
MTQLQLKSWGKKISSAVFVSGLLVTAFSGSSLAVPQNTLQNVVSADSAPGNPGVPRFVRFGGTVKDADGKIPSGDVTITFTFYEQQDGGTPLWSETQIVQPGKDGRYSVLLGATQSDGVPRDLFTSNRARWVAVQPGLAGVGEQARVLLVGVPYAIKAVDAETLGGLPASAFLLANASTSTATGQPPAAATSNQPVNAPTTSISGTGATDFIPLWTNSTALGSSALFQMGSGTTAKVGIGTTTPASTLDIKGGSTIRGTLSLPANGTATATGGKDSEPLSLAASTFNSSSSTAANQTFEWMAEPTGNDTANPAATLNLLFGANGKSAVNTGLSIAANGQIAFAPGQTFPTSGLVTSLNSLTGAVTLTAGTNITLTPNGNTLTIASTGGAGTVATNSTLTGAGTTSMPLGVAVPLSLTGASASAVVTATNSELDGLVGTSALGDGVNGNSSSLNKSGVYGANSSTGGFGVFGRNTASGSTGYIGGNTIGVSGVSASPANGTAGVYGVSQTPAGIGTVDAAGVWGDSFAGDGMVASSSQNNGIVAFTADSLHQLNAAGFFDNQSAEQGAVVLQTFGETTNGSCTIDIEGDLTCTGTKSAVVPVDNGARMVKLYAIESPQNWFEDFGSGQLANGSAIVELEATFAQTVDTDVNYHVYLTPAGDCKGLFVTQKTARSFEVHELGRGTSNVAVDYRIVAERKGYEQIRMADRTRQFDRNRLMSVVKHMKKQSVR